MLNTTIYIVLQDSTFLLNVEDVEIISLLPSYLISLEFEVMVG